MPQPCLEGAAEETIWHLSTKTRRVWNAYAQPDTTCPQSGRSDSKATLKILTLAELDKSYPATAWTQVFTDGSATRNGGCCIYIRQTKQASHYYSNTGRRCVLKLQSRSTSTPHCDRECHPAGDNTKEGCAPHRLPISTAITGIRKPRSLKTTSYEKINSKYKQPEIKNNSHTSIDSGTYRHTWKWSGGSAGKGRQQEAAAQIKTKLPRSKNAHDQKQEASWLQTQK